MCQNNMVVDYNHCLSQYLLQQEIQFIVELSLLIRDKDKKKWNVVTIADEQWLSSKPWFTITGSKCRTNTFDFITDRLARRDKTIFMEIWNFNCTSPCSVSLLRKKEIWILLSKKKILYLTIGIDYWITIFLWCWIDSLHVSCKTCRSFSSFFIKLN